MAEFFELVAFQAEGRRHHGHGGDGVAILIKHGCGGAVDAFEAFSEIGGVAALARFGEIGFESAAGGERGWRVLLELYAGEEAIEFSRRQMREDGFAGSTGIHGHLEADGAADLDGLAGDALLEHGHLVVHAGEELRGLAGGIAQPFEGFEGADDEALFAHLRAGEVEKFVGEHEALVVLTSLEVAAAVQRAGDAKDGVHRQVELAGDLSEAQPGAMAAEEFEDGQRALRSGREGIFGG